MSYVCELGGCRVGSFAGCFALSLVCLCAMMSQTGESLKSSDEWPVYLKLPEGVLSRRHDSRPSPHANKHEHRASDGATATTTTLNSRSLAPPPRRVAQRCASALEPTTEELATSPRENDSSYRMSSSSRLNRGSATVLCILYPNHLDHWAVRFAQS